MRAFCGGLWRNVFFALPLFVALAMSACSQNQQSKDKVVDNDESGEVDRSKNIAFLSLVSEMSIEDIRLARLAQERSSTESIRELAKKIEAGHTMVLNHINVFSEKKGLPLSTKTPEENEFKVLVNLQGQNFDEEFCGYMAKEHENAIDNLQQAANEEFMDADIKTWADSMIPVFRSNMETAASHLSRMNNESI